MKKRFFLLALACLSITAQAQTQRQTNDPNSGHFDIIKHTAKGEEHINVNYVLQPAPFTNLLRVFLNTPDPMQLSVKIVNDAGVTVMNWMPQKNYTYEKEFDISNLKAGKYKLEIYGENGSKVHTVFFDKQTATTN